MPPPWNFYGLTFLKTSTRNLNAEMIQQLFYRYYSSTTLTLTVKVPELAQICTPLSQSQLSFSYKMSSDWLRSVHFHAKNVHVQGL